MAQTTKLPAKWSPRDWAEQARQSHTEAIANAQSAMQQAMLCGRLLAEARKNIRGGDWETWLESTEIPRRSAYRYMQLANAAAESGREDMADGGTLTDLYRSYGILPERSGGGHRAASSDATPARRPLFDACIFETSLRLLTDDATDLSDLPSAQLHGQRDLLTTAIARLDNELANRAGIAERGES